MSKVVVVNHVSLDGVMQAPGRPDEDPRGGFEHGGWAQPQNDPVMGQAMAEDMSKDSALLLGRWTYESFANFWSNQTDNPFTEPLNNTQKYVASRSLRAPLSWSNSTLLENDATDAVAELKQRGEQDLTILGSGELIHSLMRRDLIDEWMLLIHPLVLGVGRRLFPEGTSARLQLQTSLTTTTGVVIARYSRPTEQANPDD
jgi:dihydrofolate reductase